MESNRRHRILSQKPAAPLSIVPIDLALPHCDPLPVSDFAGLFTWQLHVKTNRFHWCDGEIPNDGDPESEHGIDVFLQIVSAEDRPAVTEDLSAALSGVSADRNIMLCPSDAEAFCVRLKTVPICDRSARVVSILGLCYVQSSPTDEVSRKRAVLLAQAEEIANFGTWEFDLESRFGTLSPHLAEMLGVAPEARLSEAEYWKRIHPADRAPILETVSDAVAAGRPFHYVARYFSPAGGTRHHFVRGLSNFDRNGRLTSIVGVMFDFTDRTHIEGELHRLSQRLLSARDDERRSVARELHESTGQTLAAVKMSLGRLREVLPEGAHRLQALLLSTLDLAETAVREVRTLSYLMHPPMLDEAGLRSAVHWYAKGFTERSGIPIEVSIPEDFGRYDQELEITLFRIVQEALTNIHRYSGSRNASIRVTTEDGLIHAVIQDDGCGLPSPDLVQGRTPPFGVGIAGMRERVKQLNGRFEIHSTPGRGTTIRATLPLGLSSRVAAHRIRMLQD